MTTALRVTSSRASSTSWNRAGSALREGEPGFEVIACIDGRGFGIRREDMRRLLVALEGKVFTLSTLKDLVGNTGLSRFAS